jgi:hypothetical protein
MGCGASKDVVDVKKLSAESQPITEAGASEDAARISNQEEIPVPSANIACETTTSVQVLGWRRVEDRLPTASEDRPAGIAMRRFPWDKRLVEIQLSECCAR